MVKLAERSAAYIWNPNGDIDFINPSAIMADISAGDLKNAETGVAGKFHPPPPLGSMRGGFDIYNELRELLLIAEYCSSSNKFHLVSPSYTINRNKNQSKIIKYE